MKTHHYQIRLDWTGNDGQGTETYRSYRRDHELSTPGKIVIPASSDPAFRGDPTRYNPEELLLASLAGCHMLWFLHLCSANGVVVTAYSDEPEGQMAETASGSGHFTAVTLKPNVRVKTAAMVAQLDKLHEEANRFCFIANSVNFPVHHEGVGEVEDQEQG